VREHRSASGKNPGTGLVRRHFLYQEQEQVPVLVVDSAEQAPQLGQEGWRIEQAGAAPFCF
jgi:hypothetical protein